MADISLKDQKGEVHFGEERYPLKEELIVKQKAKIEAGQIEVGTQQRMDLAALLVHKKLMVKI